jgi:pyrrolysine biosynthesis protein PylC
MKNIAIIGGKLQGTEACYLARRAGIRATLIDLHADAPASGLADEVIPCDIRAASGAVIRALRKADLVLPALEDDEALDAIAALAEHYSLPLAFSPEAYAITSSKKKSDALIRKLGIPAPRHADHTVIEGSAAGEAIHPGQPWLVKPSRGSGSRGVRVFPTLAEARAYAAAQPPPDEYIVQEYLDGPSYSIEVIGRPGSYRTYRVTQIHVDGARDCNLVTTPCAVTEEQDADLRASAVCLAEAVGLRGIMDVEAILHDGRMKVLEIDARLPSQTPAAVLASTGENFISELITLSLRAQRSNPQDDSAILCDASPKYAAYENILVTADGIHTPGEHIMSDAGPLTLRQGWCGADFSMTDRREGCKEFRGIFINAAPTEKALAQKRERMMNEIKDLPTRTNR